MDSASPAIVADALAPAVKRLARINGPPQPLAYAAPAVSLLLITGVDRRDQRLPTRSSPGGLVSERRLILNLRRIQRKSKACAALFALDRKVAMMQPNENRKPTADGPSASPTPSGQSQEFQDLELAFLGSLVPGIIHNMATPLSGVLGATQLLEKRAATISELLSDGESTGEAERTELLKQLERNRANVDILARNARHLADILQTLVQRINRGSSSVKEYHSLNELLQDELRFLDAHLAFKHKVKKQLSLGPEVRTGKFIYGHVAAALDDFITSSMAAHDFKQGGMEMDFRTGPADSRMALWIEVRCPSVGPEAEECATLCSCLNLLRAEGWTAEVENGEGVRRLHLLCPRETVPA